MPFSIFVFVRDHIVNFHRCRYLGSDCLGGRSLPCFATFAPGFGVHPRRAHSISANGRFMNKHRGTIERSLRAVLNDKRIIGTGGAARAGPLAAGPRRAAYIALTRAGSGGSFTGGRCRWSGVSCQVGGFGLERRAS